MNFVFITNKKDVQRNQIMFVFLILKNPDSSKLLSSYRRFYRPDFLAFSPQQQSVYRQIYLISDRYFFHFVSRTLVYQSIYFISKGLTKGKLYQNLHLKTNSITDFITAISNKGLKFYLKDPVTDCYWHFRGLKVTNNRLRHRLCHSATVKVSHLQEKPEA